MTEILFYHLERFALERVLPQLLERCLERDWRVVVEASSPERIAALDTLLWTYRDESFLPHGTARGPDAERQPILLTDGQDNPNRANVRFLVDGAPFSASPDYDRIVYMFDGNDEAAVQVARDAWRIAMSDELANSGDHNVTYWRQDGDGKWEKMA